MSDPNGIPLPSTAGDVKARANKLAALANGIAADVDANLAAIDSGTYEAWKTFYTQQVSPTVDPYTDPVVVTNPPGVMASFDPVEDQLDEWRVKINKLLGLDRPVPPATPPPTVPVPLPPNGLPSLFSDSTKVLFGLGLAVVILALLKVK